MGGVFDCPTQEARLKEIEIEENNPALWSQVDKAKILLTEKSRIQESLNGYQSLVSQLEDLEGYCELLKEDPSILDDIVLPELQKLTQQVRRSEIRQMFSLAHDKNNAIVSINAGAGGTEAQDWALMLLRMYLRYCERQGFKTQLLDEQVGEEAGIKSATFTVEGDYPYGLLSSEIGVHRLVRISPFDSNHRRHTSFASVFVYPDIEKEIEIEVLEKDLRVDTYRAGGAGGQHVNKTDSAVRLTHLPSGIVVQCQNERSQHQNRQMAMKILKARLYEREKEKKMSAQQKIEDSKKDIAWGSQIRSYVIHPYRLVKDHRTNFEVGDVMSVLDGDLESLIEAYLTQKVALRNKKE